MVLLLCWEFFICYSYFMRKRLVGCLLWCIRICDVVYFIKIWIFHPQPSSLSEPCRMLWGKWDHCRVPGSKFLFDTPILLQYLVSLLISSLLYISLCFSAPFLLYYPAFTNYNFRHFDIQDRLSLGLQIKLHNIRFCSSVEARISLLAMGVIFLVLQSRDSYQQSSHSLELLL